MTDPRLLKDQVEAICHDLQKAITHRADPAMAQFYINHADKIVEEFKRELYWSNKPSGTV